MRIINLNIKYITGLTVIIILCIIYWKCIGLIDLNSNNYHHRLQPGFGHTTNNYDEPIQIFNKNVESLQIPSVILRPITGSGIGDQLYRYAYAYATARSLNAQLYLGISSRNELESNRSFRLTDRSFVLDNFKLNSSLVHYILESDLDSINQTLAHHLSELGAWRSSELPKDKIIVVGDYWQSHIYFDQYKDELSQQLILRHNNHNNDAALALGSIEDEINDCESVCVHVRRGDFVQATGTPHDRVIPISFQLAAIELMNYLLTTRQNSKEIVKYFIFSDDIEYVRHALVINNINFNKDIVFVSNSTLFNSLDEFSLMRQCKHNIITNSGYSWWTAYLNSNPSKLIIAPFPRHRQKFYSPYGEGAYRKHKEWLYWNYSYPRSWITINPYVSFEDSL